MSRIQKTKKGVAAIYIVVFTTMLIGIITLSFLRIMLSESGRTLNDTLSDSAYNAALAGVEDAKYVVSKYQKLAGEGHTSGESNSQGEFMEKLEGSNNDNCDIIDEALSALNNVAPSTGETTIGTGESRTDQDQAYTCVTIKLNGNYRETLTANNPTALIPLKPYGKAANDIDGVKISWNMGTDSDSFYGNGLQDLNNSELNGIVNNEEAIKMTNPNRVLGQKGIIANDATASDDRATAMNGLRVMLVQSSARNHDYYAANTTSSMMTTNRGTLMLLASSRGVNEIGANQLVYSADKTLNAPISVQCSNESCSAKIYFPKPLDGGDREPDNFFLVVNQLYSEPSVTITVNMFKGTEDVDFFNVQPIVDATGRSGDLFRRVEARIGNKNGASLLPTAELSSNSTIDKSFYVTKNCINGTSECH